jgi:hypothetical protein
MAEINPPKPSKILPVFGVIAFAAVKVTGFSFVFEIAGLSVDANPTFISVTADNN